MIGKYLLIVLVALFVVSGDCLSKEKDCKCKVRTASRIVGGRQVNRDSYPWIGSISNDGYNKLVKRDYVLDDYKYQNGHSCGAIVLNEEWVLTAAHCAMTPEKLAVGFGSNDLKELFDIGRIKVKNVTFFSGSVNDSTITDDIALIQLEEALVFNKTVQPACLSNSYISETSDELIAAGFGSTKPVKLNMKTTQMKTPLLSRYLKEVTLRDVSQNAKDCRSDPKKLCANSIRSGESLCGGDSGGPVHMIEGGRAYVVGIGSNSKSHSRSFLSRSSIKICDGKQVFQRVEPYLEFITSTAGDVCTDLDL